VKDLSKFLDKQINRVGEMTDEELMDVSLVIERALIHMLVEQQLRVNASVSHLKAV